MHTTTDSSQRRQKMEAKGKKILILVEEIFNDFEFFYPYFRLKEAGADVVVVAPEKGKTYHGKYGTPATADMAAEEVETKNFDGLVIPGGYAPDHMRRHPDMVRVVKEMAEGGNPVAAICHAGWMLASAGILPEKTVTSFFAIKDDLVHAGANWKDEEVVVDGNLITSRTPDDLPAFMRELLKALSGADV